MNRVIFIVIVFIVLSCKERTTEDLEKKKISYRELPSPAKYAFFNYSDYRHIKEMNNIERYEYSSKQTFMLPWVYKGYISKKGSNKKYRIDPNETYGYPYVVYGDSLYIPNNRISGLVEEDSLKYTFTRFILK